MGPRVREIKKKKKSEYHSCVRLLEESLQDKSWILFVIKPFSNYVPHMTHTLVVWPANRTSVHRKVVNYAKYYC